MHNTEIGLSMQINGLDWTILIKKYKIISLLKNIPIISSDT